MTSLVVRKVTVGGVLKLKRVPVRHAVISGGVLKLERVLVICPACGQQIEAVATDGWVKGYCAVAKQRVNFLIETQLERAKLIVAQKGRYQDPDYRAKMSAAIKKLWQDPDYQAKMSAAIKKRWQEHRAKQNALLYKTAQ